MSLVTLNKPPKSSAPGQYLGYSIQPVRMCTHLLIAQYGVNVSLEYLDDVAAHPAVGRLLLEQSKSALTGNPVSDRSTELWKTFGNWADIAADGTIDAQLTDFRMYVSPAHSGDVVAAMDAATTEKAADITLQMIKKWIKPGAEAKGCLPHVIRFLAAGDATCKSIIINFRLTGAADPLEEIKQFLRITLPESVVNDFCAAAIGQAKEVADRLIRDGKPAVIDASAFRRQFQAFVRKHNLAGLLTPTTGNPDPAQIKTTIDSAPVFVRQLDAINIESDLVVGAVSACLRTKADKIKWAADGLIVEESLSEFDEELAQRFFLVKDGIEDVHASSDIKQRGRMIYRQCASVQLPLEGRALPGHFVTGAYNLLADTLRIGWHPDYIEILGNS